MVTIGFIQIVWNNLLIQTDYDSMISNHKSWESNPNYMFTIWIRKNNGNKIATQECRKNCKTGFVYPDWACFGERNEEYLQLMQDFDAALIDDSILSELPDTLQMIVISLVNDYISCFT